MPLPESPFFLSSEPLDVVALRAALENPACGGVVVFEGLVRDHNDGRAVRRLEYEAYEALAVAEGAAILREARERFGVPGVVCAHRTGRLEIGDLAVWVGVASGHRGEAFAACRYVIDEVKRRVPVWKREHYADGSDEWVNCAACADPAQASHAHSIHGHATPPDELERLPQGPGSMDEDLGA